MSIKVIATNKKAYHDYFVEESYEAGLVLLGTEIKSLRQGKVQLKESFISFKDNQAIIKGMNISEYRFGNRFNHQEDRERLLLLHKLEIIKLQQKAKLDGYTIIPLKIYLKKGLAKLEIALCKGKNLHDKRESDKIKSMNMQALKALKR